jgi:hypothetical protein
MSVGIRGRGSGIERTLSATPDLDPENTNSEFPGGD